ncbi:MAG TPA: ferrous iron transport protein A [Syntrophomonadaceae bacterium]|nr:ferrous iron transport protein A [Syntrophomonadaceae bacterium]
MKCSFCGCEFNETTAHGCGPCPLHTTCGKVKCPNCGFEMPKENLITKWFRRRRRGFGKGQKEGRGLRARKGQHRHERITLSQLSNGDEAVISQIDTSDQGTLNKIMALGILPGIRVTMIQRYPTFVFQVGNTRVTADENLVNKILINR